MKYKVGDKVKVKSLEWHDAMIKDNSGCIRYNKESFVGSMKKHCGKEAVVVALGKDYYSLDIDRGLWSWYDWALEDEFEVQKDKDLIPNVLNAESLEEKRFHAACCAMNGILSTEYSKPIPNDKIVQMSYMLADELLRQGGFTE